MIRLKLTLDLVTTWKEQTKKTSNKMKTNGKIVTLTNRIPLKVYLLQEGYEIGIIAVEKNGRIVPKQDYENEILCNDDVLEIVQFVGGG